ncbi:extracellular solute-binding protein [Labrys monachus]|uniref:Multiple sugar transport system substrate-binding protein n=1 Tax=Labrys monachus TaxID=217067 RepID=A0ABU0FA69_9HYPH|nr:extracellular solute-binding protein [Labrys monachus]MDQ0391431.1 multiple sugar transport system substrate-binding protein [Labrys monachus]
MTRLLRGITWDHPRGYDPLAKGAAAFAALHPGIEVEWSRRSLRDFGVQPVEVLAEQFDLLVIDHPFSGRARTSGCLRDLRTLLPADFLAMLERESVGPSTRSYDFGGLWALPTDAAAQVASYRPDLVAALGFDGPPRRFEEVIALGETARRSGKWLALPSCQSDAACLVASLSANLGVPIAPGREDLLPPEVFETVLGLLERLIALSHPESTSWNPIRTYDAMTAGDDIVYVPFGFGYSNYSRAGGARPLRFTTVAGPGADPAAGAILGGAGCAVSARCADIEAAAAYLTWLHQPAYQAGDYFRNGGQPGLRTAWTDPQIDREAGSFFSGTLETLDKAFLRPRFDGFIHAFEHMGLLVHRWLAEGGDRAAVIRSSNDAYARAQDAAPASA